MSHVFHSTKLPIIGGDIRMNESRALTPCSFRFDSRAVARLEDLKKSLNLSSRKEVIEISLKALSVLSDIADKDNKVIIKSGDRDTVLFLD